MWIINVDFKSYEPNFTDFLNESVLKYTAQLYLIARKGKIPFEILSPASLINSVI